VATSPKEEESKEMPVEKFKFKAGNGIANIGNNCYMNSIV
jgi:ubiquitin C-terminal hydrolase